MMRTNKHRSAAGRLPFGTDGIPRLARPGRTKVREAGARRSPSHFTLPAVEPEQPASVLIRAALRSAVSRIEHADPEARRGEVEGVHHLRTATRRLRSELRTVRPLVDSAWAGELESELKWLADLLGGVRDLDILAKRLRDAEDELAAEAAPGEGSPELHQLHDSVSSSLNRRHHDRTLQLREGLQGDRYRRLIALLRSSTETPTLTPRAEKPCRKVLPHLARQSWKTLRKRARKLSPRDPDEAFHKVRKLAKQARYSAELIAPALGPDMPEQARRFIRLATRVQDVLGEHQDATVAAEELRHFLADHPEDRRRARMIRAAIRAQQEAADRARDTFFKVWPRLDRKKSTRWLRWRAGAKE